MVHVRIFADEDSGIEKILAYIEKSDKLGLEIQLVKPGHWLPNPSDTPANYVNIHVSVPCRLALPYAGFNILAAGDVFPKEWSWADDKMDLLVCSWDTSRASISPGKTFREAAENWRRALSLARAKAKVKETAKAVTGQQTPVSVITISKNGPAWFPNMVQNVLGQDWPAVQWIIVGGDLKAQVEKLKSDNPRLNVTWLNDGDMDSAIKVATYDMIAIMDDDVHYPSSSITKRMEGLQHADMVYCATLPVYDIRQYMSSMCVPPLRKLPHLRAFDASFAFKKSFWVTQDLIQSRETKTAEISPADVLVGLVHKGNQDARFASDIEKGIEPNGCHYGFSEKYFQYLHSIGEVPSL